MGQVTGQAADLPLTERSVRSGNWMSLDRMILRKGLVETQELPALHLREGQREAPRTLPFARRRDTIL